MYIVSDTNDDIESLRAKYLVLELDTFEFPNGNLMKNYCVVDSEHVTLQEIYTIDQFRDLHSKLMENYKKQNWDYCHNAIALLQGKFKGELDTFYQDMLERIDVLKTVKLNENWAGSIRIKN